MTRVCCAPSAYRPGSPTGTREAPPPSASAAALLSADLVHLQGGTFTMGSDGHYGYPEDGEGPAHEVALDPFAISRHAISNARFATFVAATDHRTEAERFGWSFVFAGLLPVGFPETRAVADAPWWRQVEGADWAHPEGPHSAIESRMDHPAIHLSFNDAQAFCTWSATRLPTEAEWEFAARGGLVQRRFPWGNEREPDGEHRMNVFQGRFPAENACADGYAGTAPVHAFGPNGLGLRNVTGNVWEWTADWFHPGYYRESPRENPTGPLGGRQRVMRGGSYLCHASYCDRYRVDARGANTPDSSTGNLGFRVARDAREGGPAALVQ